MIIALYNNRDERAIAESELKYGKYCYTIAHNILCNREDSEECVNDTWLRAWNVIPPQIPKCLRAFLGKITRNLAFDKQKYNQREKRSPALTVSLEELSDCVSTRTDVEEDYIAEELGRSISRFLEALSERDRNVFVARYYFLYSLEDIAERFEMKENYIRNLLSRTRKKLKIHLEKEGYSI